MSSGVEVEDGRVMAFFDKPADTQVGGAAGQDYLHPPEASDTVVGECESLFGGGSNGGGEGGVDYDLPEERCEMVVSGAFNLSCIAENGKASVPGDVVLNPAHECCLPSGENQPCRPVEHTIAGNLGQQNEFVEEEQGGASKMVDTVGDECGRTCIAVLGGAEEAAKPLALSKPGDNVVDSAVTALKQSASPNCDQSCQFSEQLEIVEEPLIDGNNVEEDSFGEPGVLAGLSLLGNGAEEWKEASGEILAVEVVFSKLIIDGLQVKAVHETFPRDEGMPPSEEEEVAVKKEDSSVLDVEVDLCTSSDATSCMVATALQGSSYLQTSASLYNYLPDVEKVSSGEWLDSDKINSKILTIDNGQVFCSTSATFSGNIGEFIAEDCRFTEVASSDPQEESVPVSKTSPVVDCMVGVESSFKKQFIALVCKDTGVAFETVANDTETLITGNGAIHSPGVASDSQSFSDVQNDEHGITTIISSVSEVQLKALNMEGNSFTPIDFASCDVSEYSAAPSEVSSMFGVLDPIPYASRQLKFLDNTCSSSNFGINGKDHLCSFLGVPLVKNCVREPEQKDASTETFMEQPCFSSDVAEVASSSAAEEYFCSGVNLISSRSVPGGSSPRITRMRNAARQCSKILEAIAVSVSKLRRKRSPLCRRGRSSVWGTLVRITEVFVENKRLLKCDDGQLKSSLQNSKSRSGRQRRQKKIQSRGSRHRSNDKKQSKTGISYSKVSGVDSSTLFQLIINDCLQKLDAKVNAGIFSGVAVERELELDSGKMDDQVQMVDFLRDKDLESTVTQVENGQDNSLGIASHIVSEISGEATFARNMDSGASPDSLMLHTDLGATEENVDMSTLRKSLGRDEDSGKPSSLGSMSMNLCLLSSICMYGGEKYQNASVCMLLEGGMLSSSHETAAPEATVSLKMQQKCIERGSIVINANDSPSQMTDPDQFSNTESTKKEKRYSRRRPQKRAEGAVDLSSNNLSTSELLQLDPPLSERAQPGIGFDSSKAESGHKASKYAHVATEITESTLRRKSRNVDNKQRRKKSDSVESPKGKSCRQRKGTTMNKSVSKRKVNSDSLSSEVANLNKIHAVGNDSNVAIEGSFTSEIQVACNHPDLEPLPRVAWVRCDDCFKWRCISVELAEKIEETNCKWICKDNADKRFADCSMPQEKSNAEINAELQISDASGDEGLSRMEPLSKRVGPSELTAKQLASWTPIEHNIFLHRNRRTQTIDEVMVCHCKPPSDGSLGCGEECLNRMLNIECVQGTCPCGDLCSNQQFQKHNYARFKWFRCGKKGYGLQLQENVSKGQFLIEYVGEVLDLHTYEARQRDYAFRGQKHFYFMTLNGSEVIDACAKGNLGRFINHSCEPNCRTEKWMVSGEVCIGLFALKNIKKGEEVTFDYNYVRVFGAAAKKCVCGTPGCRDYLGGDPANTEAIVQVDSDDEYPEPVMVREDGTTLTSMSETISDAEVSLDSRDELKSSRPFAKKLETLSQFEDYTTKSDHLSSICLERKDLQDEFSNAVQLLEPSICIEKDGYTSSATASNSQADSVQQADVSRNNSLDATGRSETRTEASMSNVSGVLLPDGETGSETVREIHQLQICPHPESTISKFLHDSKALDGNSLLVGDNTKQSKKGKSRSIKLSARTKSSNSFSLTKKNRSATNQVFATKSKKSVVGTINGRFEGVEEKLNELLDAEGGISRSKDATKGYLKLLLVTAASGDNANGETFQSTRDLSIILDALLKTKSRSVLLDIVNKNGLQMLHNIMKQNRRNFNKIPIIRKLLKVIEYLAVKGILTSDHIYTPPPCAGMESFKDSMIALTWHNDVQVHQMARHFRDQWIPRTIKRGYSDRDDNRDILSSTYNQFHVPHKRWHDQAARPSDANSIMESDAGSTSHGASIPSETHSVVNGNLTDGPKRVRKRKSRWDQPEETTPPGFTQSIDSQKLEAVDTKMRPIICEGIADEITVTTSYSTLQLDDTLSGTINEDAPPGFSCPNNSQVVLVNNTSSSCVADAAVGQQQPRYLGHLPVSYGIPWAVVQEFGTPEAENSGRWIVAPGMPFHPFPPLPSYPRETKSSSESPQVSGSQQRESSGSPQEVMASRCSSTSDASLPRRYFRQQKWNSKRNSDMPAWLQQQKNGWASKDDDITCIGDTQIGGSCLSETRKHSNSINSSGADNCASEDQQQAQGQNPH